MTNEVMACVNPNEYALSLVLTSSVATGLVTTPVANEYPIRNKLANVINRVWPVSNDVSTVAETASPRMKAPLQADPISSSVRRPHT